MNLKIADALKEANETKALLIAPGALKQTADLYKGQFGYQKAIVIADHITYEVAGKAVKDLLAQDGIDQEEPFIFTENELHAEYRHVEILQQHLEQTTAIPIAVGSGTINDLTKLSAHLVRRPYMIVGTAASMDGYTSFGASITANNAKQTFNCPAPRVVLADIDIMAQAPKELTAAGYADLFSKVTAGADWIIADSLGVEPIDPKVWSIVHDGLHDALSDCDGIGKGELQSIAKLVEGLMLVGFGMQMSKSSRPASGAEHYMSHLWDMENHRYKGRNVSHGFQVSIGTLSILSFYEQIMKIDLSELNVKSCCDQWISLENLEKNAFDTFGKTPFIDRVLQESKAKYIDKDALEEQLNHLKKNWKNIKYRVQNQLIGFKDAQRYLSCVGAPSEPEQIGISRRHLRETIINGPLIRNRLTILDLAQRAGLTNACLDGMFGKGAHWEI